MQKKPNKKTKHLEKQIKKVLAEGKLTPKAIIPVDLFGQPADYDKIMKIAKKYNKLGFTVVVQCRESSARILGEEYFRLGENNNKKSTKKAGKR